MDLHVYSDLQGPTRTYRDLQGPTRTHTDLHGRIERVTAATKSEIRSTKSGTNSIPPKQVMTKTRNGHLVAWASSPKESEKIPWTLGCGAGYTDLHGRRCAADVAQASLPKESEKIPWTLGCGAGYTDRQGLARTQMCDGCSAGVPACNSCNRIPKNAGGDACATSGTASCSHIGRRSFSGLQSPAYLPSV
jgi:hypothetical protein